MRLLLLAIGSLGLSGCSILFPEDPRKGVEPVDQCVARLTKDLIEFAQIEDPGQPLVPTYTYDITILPFEKKQELIVPGSDETLGTRLMKQTNEASTAMAQFNEWPVDEKGAFFFGVEPALFRVRGDPVMLGEMLRAGCERQAADMRLIRVDVGAERPEPEPEQDTQNETPE